MKARQSISDIVLRLRDDFDLHQTDSFLVAEVYTNERREAANEIERLRALVNSLEARVPTVH